MSRAIGVSLFALLVASSAQTQQIGDVFYIALEITIYPAVERDGPCAYVRELRRRRSSTAWSRRGNANARADIFRGQLSETSRPDFILPEPNYVWRNRGPTDHSTTMTLAHQLMSQRSSPSAPAGGERSNLAFVPGGHRS
jgi:hypothetical protein